MQHSRIKQTVVLVLKLGLAAALLYYLYHQASANDKFDELRNTSKDWGLLALATGCCLVSILITFVRWMILVRAVGLPFTLGDALRLGFQGFALNFVSLGNVGGDLFKAIFIAREHHGHKTEAIATVVIDRLIGLYALFLVASGTVLFGGSSLAEVDEVRILKTATLVCTAVGAVVLAAFMIPGPLGRRIGHAATALPLVGHVAGKLIRAMRLYRQRYPSLLVALLLSLCVHVLLAVTLWLVASGLLGAAPTLVEHLFITPLAALAGAVPIVPAGLGTFEFALDFLYQQAQAGGAVAAGDGLIVALAYRVITMLAALVGVYYLVRGRKKVVAAMHEAQEEAEAGDPLELDENGKAGPDDSQMAGSRRAGER